MTRPARASRTLTRRQFVGAGVAACTCCAVAGAGLAREFTPLPAPTADLVAAPPHGQVLPRVDAPILLLLHPGHSFSAYVGAILRAEGIVSYDSAPIELADLAMLRRHAVVILPPGSLTPDQAAALSDYVHLGGSLVAFQPDPALADLMGVRYLGSRITDGYLKVTGHAVAEGISTYPLQFHGEADRVQLRGAELIAQLDDSATLVPLVTLNRAGAGIAAMWAFDFARSIALIRQGDPSAFGQDRDPVPGVRTQDSFVGWADLDRLDVPQADEQQRLLVRLIEEVGGDRMILPRLWYFPHTLQGVMIATSDAHGMPADVVERGLTIYDQYDATGTVYYATAPATTVRRFARRVQYKLHGLPVIGWAMSDDSGYPTQGHVQRWRERGHRIGLHPFVEDGVEAGYSRFYGEFVRSGYGEPDASVRTHRTLWDGWVETAKVQARYGLRMNLDFYHAGILLHGREDKYMTGYLSGSGLPMPFVDQDGTVLNIFQQHTHLVDEHLMPLFGAGTDIGLSAEDALRATRRIIDRLQRYPTAIGMQWHLDPLSFGEKQQRESERWIHGTLSYARMSGVPVMSAERWLQFTQMRADATLTTYRWSPPAGRVTFMLRSPSQSQDTAELLLPMTHAEREFKAVLADGVPVPHTVRVVNGRRYAAFAAQSGAQIECHYRAA